MDSVSVNITADGYEVIVNLHGKTYRQKWIRTSGGSSRMEEGEDFEGIDAIPDGLYDALNSFFAFDVMQALQECEE